MRNSSNRQQATPEDLAKLLLETPHQYVTEFHRRNFRAELFGTDNLFGYVIFYKGKLLQSAETFENLDLASEEAGRAMDRWQKTEREGFLILP